ncbi:MAG TPA: hypothetical protein VIG51_05130 [Candidatus Baltobacteraceae bacterium]|jgi:hypothetical protein
MLLLCSAARADDFGPQQDVATIRGDVPSLLARLFYERNLEPSQVVVSDIVVDGDAALANWQIGSHQGLIGLRRVGGTWRDVLEGYADASEAAPDHESWWFEGAAPWFALPYDESYYGPTSGRLLAIGLPKRLVREVVRHNAVVAASNGAQRSHDGNQSPRPDAAIVPSVDRGFMYLPPNVTQNGSSHGGNRVETGGYEIVLVLAPNDAPPGASVTISGHEPVLRGHGLFSVQFAFAHSGTVDFASVSRINVWFPYVLDSRKSYTLSMKWPLGTSEGDLHDNILTFELPPFAARAGETFAGEIYAR